MKVRVLRPFFVEGHLAKIGEVIDEALVPEAFARWTAPDVGRPVLGTGRPDPRSMFEPRRHEPAPAEPLHIEEVADEVA